MKYEQGFSPCLASGLPFQAAARRRIINDIERGAMLGTGTGLIHDVNEVVGAIGADRCSAETGGGHQGAVEGLEAVVPFDKIVAPSNVAYHPGVLAD